MWTLFSLGMAALVIYRVILPLKSGKGVKIALSALTILVALKFQILRLFGGPHFFAPALPRSVLLGTAAIYAMLFLFFLYLLALTIVLLIPEFFLRRKNHRRLPDKYLKIRNALHLLILIFASVAALVGVWRGTLPPQVKEIAIHSRLYPVECPPMRIAVLTDLHIDAATPETLLPEIVRRTNALNPDVIVLLGDLADGKVDELGDKLRPLGRLRAAWGVYAVTGNHEYFYNWPEWQSFLDELGISVLENARTQMPNGVWLAGVPDPETERFGFPAPSLDFTVGSLPQGDCIVLLNHRPKTARRAAALGAALQLSGHTHGGMVFGLDILVALLNGGFVSGSYQVGDMTLYVSNGTTIWKGFPIRFGCDSEISCIDFQP